MDAAIGSLLDRIYSAPDRSHDSGRNIDGLIEMASDWGGKLSDEDALRIPGADDMWIYDEFEEWSLPWRMALALRQMVLSRKGLATLYGEIHDEDYISHNDRKLVANVEAAIDTMRDVLTKLGIEAKFFTDCNLDRSVFWNIRPPKKKRDFSHDKVNCPPRREGGLVSPPTTEGDDR